jgi:hypothetical protein
MHLLAAPIQILAWLVALVAVVWAESKIDLPAPAEIKQLEKNFSRRLMFFGTLGLASAATIYLTFREEWALRIAGTMVWITVFAALLSCARNWWSTVRQLAESPHEVQVAARYGIAVAAVHCITWPYMLVRFWSEYPEASAGISFASAITVLTIPVIRFERVHRTAIRRRARNSTTRVTTSMSEQANAR